MVHRVSDRDRAIRGSDRSTAVDDGRPAAARGGRFVAVSVAVAASLVLLVAGCGAGGSGASAGSAATVTSSGAGSDGAAAASAWLASFHGTTVDGKTFDGASLAGKPTVLWFWAPWCPTCLMQAPGIRDAIAGSGTAVNIVGVAGLDKAAAMPDFVRMARIGTITNISDPAGAVWKRFHVIEQSYFVFLDASGKEVYRGKLSPEDIASRVAALTA